MAKTGQERSPLQEQENSESISKHKVCAELTKCNNVYVFLILSVFRRPYREELSFAKIQVDV